MAPPIGTAVAATAADAAPHTAARPHAATGAPWKALREAPQKYIRENGLVLARFFKYSTTYSVNTTDATSYGSTVGSETRSDGVVVPERRRLNHDILCLPAGSCVCDGVYCRNH